MDIRKKLNNCARVLFEGASDSVSDMRNMIANTVCFNEASIAKMRLMLIIMIQDFVVTI